jgi:hypothetical protein
MRQGVLTIYDLNPDGVRVVVNWDSMVIGASIFIPCVNTEKATNQVKKVMALKGWECRYQVRIESDKLGLRVWRTI